MPDPPGGAYGNSLKVQTKPSPAVLLHSGALRASPVLPPPQTGCVKMKNPNPSSALVQHNIRAKATAKGLPGLGCLFHHVGEALPHTPLPEGKPMAERGQQRVGGIAPATSERAMDHKAEVQEERK